MPAPTPQQIHSHAGALRLSAPFGGSELTAACPELTSPLLTTPLRASTCQIGLTRVNLLDETASR
jgi:hypothetical protein